MKEVLVTIKVTIDQDNYDHYKSYGVSDEEILSGVKSGFNSAIVENKFVSDFEVEDIKEVKP